MSDAQVRYEDISDIRRSVQALQTSVAVVYQTTEQVSNQVAHVDNKVERVNRDLIVLWTEFQKWVKEQRNANNLQRAITEIIRVRQELDDKYGKHAEARIRLRGILDTAETGLLREFTIASCSEQIMLDTPKYWLAPSLVALAAWISNDKDLAQKAVAESLRRDAEKSALLFALVCRRAVPAMSKANEKVCNDRVDACFKWLEVYFDCQDPRNMKESVIVLIDSWANNVFGNDREKVCEGTFKKWMADLNTPREGEMSLEDKQKSHWYRFYTNHCVSTASQYQVLAGMSPEFPAADAYLQRINTAGTIQNHFDKIRNAPIDKKALVDRLDEQLNSLISEFDVEEESLRNEEKHFSLVKKYEGDMDKVRLAEARLARKKNAERASFAERLEEAVRSDDPRYNAARKTAIQEEFLGKYIQSAYHEYITDKKGAFPETISIQHKDWMGWVGKTRDGKNKEELKKSLADHLNAQRQNALSQVDKSGVLKNTIIWAVVCLVVGLIIGQFLIGLIAAAIVGFLTYRKENAKVVAQEQSINESYDKLIASGHQLIVASLDQWIAILAIVSAFAAAADKKEHLNLEIA